jgi:hypothetical protein
MIGIINFAGRGPHTSGNVWGKQLTRAGRTDPGTGMDINKWGQGAYLDTLNPLMADTVADWQCLTGLFEGHYGRNPYTLEYMWLGTTGMPTIDPWVGPGGSNAYGGATGHLATYDGDFNGTHYNGTSGDWKAVADCGPSDMLGDDVVGMVVSWELREGQYWQDSDPGPDGIFGTGDDGAVHPVTTADSEFGMNLLHFQENVRYQTNWDFVYAIEPITDLEFKIYEERRFLFAFEAHDVSLLTPKHIWEDYIGTGQIHDDGLTLTRPDGSTGLADYWDYYSVDDSGYNNHHDTWTGWDEVYMEDPQRPGWDLTYLIGNGPFTYHYGGWDPGVSVRFEANPCYYAGHVCAADIDFNQRTEPATEDVNKMLQSIGSYGAPNYLVEADTAYPAQIVDLSEISQFLDHSGHYWGPDPVPLGFVRCPTP